MEGEEEKEGGRVWVMNGALKKCSALLERPWWTVGQAASRQAQASSIISHVVEVKRFKISYIFVINYNLYNNL